MTAGSPEAKKNYCVLDCIYFDGFSPTPHSWGGEGGAWISHVLLPFTNRCFTLMVVDINAVVPKNRKKLKMFKSLRPTYEKHRKQWPKGPTKAKQYTVLHVVMYANYAYEIRTMPFQYHATFSHNFPHRPHDLYITFSHLDIIFFLSLPPLTTWLGCHFYGLDVTFSQIPHGFNISFSHIPNDKMFLSTTDQMPLIFFSPTNNRT